MTQGRKLVALLKRRQMTYLEMLLTGISTCPWKRAQEQLRPSEQLVKGRDKKGRTTWRVVSATRWSA